MQESIDNSLLESIELDWSQLTPEEMEEYIKP